MIQDDDDDNDGRKCKLLAATTKCWRPWTCVRFLEFCPLKSHVVVTRFSRYPSTILPRQKQKSTMGNLLGGKRIFVVVFQLLQTHFFLAAAGRMASLTGICNKNVFLRLPFLWFSNFGDSFRFHQLLFHEL